MPPCPLQLVEVDNIWVMEETVVCSAAKELDTLSLRVAGTHCSLACVARNTCMDCKAIFTYVGTAVCSPVYQLHVSMYMYTKHPYMHVHEE